MQHLLLAASVLVCGSFAAGDTTNFAFSSVQSKILPTDLAPTHLALGDLNGDGTVDVVLTGRNELGEIAVALGDGVGGFGAIQTVLVGAQTDWCELHDLDGNGTLDAVLAVRSPVGNVVVMPGDGNGGFGAPTFYAAGRETRGVAVLDLDDDGDLDIAAINHLSADITTLLNVAGTFAAGGRLAVNRFSGAVVFPQQILAGDLNGDGRKDLVVSAIGGRRVNVYLAEGGGAFGSEHAYAPPFFEDVQGSVINSTLGDVDGDGDIDIVTSLLFGTLYQQFSVLPNDGTGAFGAPSIFMGSFDGFAWAPALGDLDGDGDLDVIMANALPGWISIAENTSDTEGLAFKTPQMIGPKNFLRDVAVADLDHDCDLDVLSIEFTLDQLLVYRNLTVQQSGCGALATDDGVFREARPFRPGPRRLPAVLQGVTDGAEIARILGDMR